MPKSKTDDAPAMVTYRCDKGHEWHSQAMPAKNMMAFPIGTAGTIESICPHCLLNFVSLLLEKGHVGRVVIIP